MPTKKARIRVVFTDANILINLLHIERLDLLGLLEELEFVVPAPVEAEITDPEQRRALAVAADGGYLAVEPLTGLEELTRFGELRVVMGDGEAACLAMAAERGGWVATSDKKRKFRREAIRLLGPGRLLNLIGLFVIAIRQGLVTVAEADAYKEVLARNRFRLKIRSFEDVLADLAAGER